MQTLPKTIYSGAYHTGHCQGIAVDLAKGCVYYSFTTALIKTDFSGKLIGSAYGLFGHLGCIAFNPQDGKVYGSLEYKNDQIGRGILANLSKQRSTTDEKNALPAEGFSEDAFYIAIFDVDRLNRPDMDATSDGIMKAAYLKEVVDDFNGTGFSDGKTVPHRYGCSGIDGTAIGPAFGSPNKNDLCLYVAYGIYGDVNRTDNDHQVLLQYDLAGLNQTAEVLSQAKMHRSGPANPTKKYFVFTGNTVYGVQNLEYDAATDKYFLSVYRGEKPAYPNPPLFAVDRMQTPEKKVLAGMTEIGEVLALDEKGIAGYPYNIGQTGMFSVGDGRFYISHHGKNTDGDYTNVKLYKLDNSKFSIVE